MVEIYKRTQGRYTRITTFISATLLAVVTAAALSSFLAAYFEPLIAYGAPTLLVLAVGLFTLWMVNRPKTADFLIATEGEMKKVSWSNRKEVIGSTKVVIITTFVLGVVLFGVDLAFVLLFKLIGVS